MKTHIGDSLNDLRGRMGKWVYRLLDGQMIVARRPVVVDREPTEAQARHLARFRLASNYANAVFRDPVRKALYEAKAKALGKSTVRALAVGDYLNLPKVTELNIGGYKGHVGDKINVSALDDVGVVAVKVTIRDFNTGDLVEQGQAAIGDTTWEYTATVEAPRDKTLSIEAEAYDHPGNSTTADESWNAEP